ncbi:hypothetical protein VKT23_000311 [Stygiomarasmius scandens]|uniref:Uncharacterized protein n=1 Tax=Marasmiellus scandens TaxID=2682957 RepID=A0ABR1K6E5_9AGAR
MVDGRNETDEQTNKRARVWIGLGLEQFAKAKKKEQGMKEKILILNEWMNDSPHHPLGYWLSYTCTFIEPLSHYPSSSSSFPSTPPYYYSSTINTCYLYEFCFVHS